MQSRANEVPINSECEQLPISLHFSSPRNRKIWKSFLCTIFSYPCNSRVNLINQSRYLCPFFHIITSTPIAVIPSRERFKAHSAMYSTDRKTLSQLVSLAVVSFQEGSGPVGEKLHKLRGQLSFSTTHGTTSTFTPQSGQSILLIQKISRKPENRMD